VDNINRLLLNLWQLPPRSKIIQRLMPSHCILPCNLTGPSMLLFGDLHPNTFGGSGSVVVGSEHLRALAAVRSASEGSNPSTRTNQHPQCVFI